MVFVESTDLCKNGYLSKVEIAEERSFESIKKDRDDCVSEVGIYYDALDEIHGIVEWEIIDSIENKMELIEMPT